MTWRLYSEPGGSDNLTIAHYARHHIQTASLTTHIHSIYINVSVCKVGCELITAKIWHAHGCCVYV